MDISIKNIKSYVFEPKTPALRLARAKEITTHELVVTEKIDGTKLTLVRTKLDDSNYENNWIVAYKGTILHAAEFLHLTDKDRENLSNQSIGIGQYALIFEHLKKINKIIKNIPKNTEFSIEFAQNKDTLTRTYTQKGGMFLRSYATVEYRILGGHLFTNPIGKEETDPNRLESMAKSLSIFTFPIFYSGKIDGVSLKTKSPAIWQHMAASEVDWNDPLSVIEKFSETVLEIPSTLGGKTEGVVIKLDDGKFFKIVQQDQYDAEVRGQKKASVGMDQEKTTEYFRQIRKLIRGVMNKVYVAGNPGKTISSVNQIISKLPDTSLPKHEKKSPLQVRDDVHETLRLLVSKGELLGGKETKSVGLIPIAGKPLHLGHWKLIEKASNENNVVIVYTSNKDRVKTGEFPIYGKDFVKFWTDFFIPNLPKNVKVKIVDSPIKSVGHELGWYEQIANQDKEEIPLIKIYSDKTDAEDNFGPEELSKYVTLNGQKKIQVIGVDRATTVNISGTKMREFLKLGDRESFIKNLPPVSDRDKEEIWNTLIKNKPQDMKEFIHEVIDAVLLDLILESGGSVAMVDPKTPKTVNGEEARASTKLSIVDKGGNDIHNKVSDDIKELVVVLNNKIKFWKKNNPYIQNGHIFNGSSQFLMNPEKRGKLVGVKNTFGDVDVIVPKSKLDDLENYLDTIDDGNPEWTRNSKNGLTNAFAYVGRTKSYAGIPDQLVTLWFYQPAGHVVQVDFEGDDMTTDDNGFEKPSEWAKFTKDSPWNDLQKGIKGLAGALMLRALARAVSKLDNAVVLTGRGLKNVLAGATELKDSDVSLGAQHSTPSKYTLNTGGGGTGIREAYKFVKKVIYKGAAVNAYRFVEAKETKPEERITDISKIFQVIFGKVPSGTEKAEFRSFQGQLELMKKYLQKPVRDVAMQRFVDILANEPLSPKERSSISKATKDILGIDI